MIFLIYNKSLQIRYLIKLTFSVLMKKWANIFRYTARTALLVMGIITFLFGLVSGAEMEHGIINGIIDNSPNALPGLVLLVSTAIAWKYELIGGALITLFGFFLVYFFNFTGINFFLTTFILTVLITTLGLFFIASWFIRRRHFIGNTTGRMEE